MHDDWIAFCRLDEDHFVDSGEAILASAYYRNRNVLSLLEIEPNSEVTFQGLKRKLGWHQEVLSRTLKRLEKDGMLQKTPTGAYRLKTTNEESNRNRSFPLGAVPVTKVWLPRDLNQNNLVSGLKNTWFGSWRWYGFNDQGSDKILTWLSEDGVFWVSLRITEDAMFVEAGPIVPLGRDRCIRAGYELLGHVIRLCQSGLTELKTVRQTN